MDENSHHTKVKIDTRQQGFVTLSYAIDGQECSNAHLRFL